MHRLLFLVLTVFSGCVSSPDAAVDPLGAAPADFTVDVQIRRGPEAAEQTDVHLRAGRIVLFPDGSLHFCSGDDVDVADLPPKVRTVSRRDLTEVWSFVQQAGLGDQTSASEPINFDLLEPPGNGFMYLIAIQGHRERWVFVRRVDGTQAPDPAGERLIRWLAELAWASDIPEQDVVIIPRRYDLGPDPYQRYREP
jgi:hypothetical protein